MQGDVGRGSRGDGNGKAVRVGETFYNVYRYVFRLRSEGSTAALWCRQRVPTQRGGSSVCGNITSA